MSVASSGAPSAKDLPPLATRSLDRCLACGGTALRPLPFAYEYRGRFPAAECRTCGMRFLTVQPMPEALAGMYSAEYFESDFRCGRSEAPYSSEEAFREENRGLLDDFGRLTPPGRLLEVGSAGGWLLKHAIERGWRAQGVELSADAVTHARALGLEVFHGELIGARLPAATFDLVYMGDVLEHVPDCRAVVAETARVLRPGGVLYLRGPITTNSLARSLAMRFYGAIGRTRVLREPPYHLWEFTPRPLARLFERCGLEVLETRQSKIAPGRARGRAASAERTLMSAVDALNVPLTRAFNARGDRVVMVGRRRG
jgi:SAM-dependent methyltransferase